MKRSLALFVGPILLCMPLTGFAAEMPPTERCKTLYVEDVVGFRRHADELEIKLKKQKEEERKSCGIKCSIAHKFHRHVTPVEQQYRSDLWRISYSEDVIDLINYAERLDAAVQGKNYISSADRVDLEEKLTRNHPGWDYLISTTLKSKRAQSEKRSEFAQNLAHEVLEKDVNGELCRGGKIQRVWEILARESTP